MYHTNSCTVSFTLVIQFDINVIRFVFCISQSDDHSLKEGKVCLQVLYTHELRICLPNSSFRARTFLQSFVPRKRAL